MKQLNLLAFVVFALLLTWVFMLGDETKRKIQRPILSVFGIVDRAAHALAADEDIVNGVNIGPDALVEKYNEQELAERYSYLLREVMELRVIKAQYAQIQRDNLRLRESLGFLNAQDPSEELWRYVPARVIKRESSTWWNELKINKGSADGLVLNSPVLTTVMGRDSNPRPAFVGKVTKLTKHTADILLMTDERCKVAARVQGTLESGLLMGWRAQDGSPVLKLRYLSKNTKEIRPELSPEVNSTDAGVVPVNYFLGIVKDFKSLEFYGEATVEPAVDFAQLTDVFVRVPTDATSVRSQADAADSRATSTPRAAIPVDPEQADGAAATPEPQPEIEPAPEPVPSAIPTVQPEP
ncbi:MAG: rod shape-determining protein MreC [Pseudoalteromonas tetraodonis]|jgi:rod shape-determining protein MreC